MVATLVAVALSGVASSAEIDKNSCARAYVEGQKLRRGKKLIVSRIAFTLCARTECPVAFQPECAEWLSEVEKAIPSVVIEARGTDGLARRDVRVQVDGEPLAERLDGTSFELDPGEHSFVLSWDGRRTERRALVVEGAKSRVLSFDLEPRPRSERKPVSRLPEVGLLALGGLALASFGYFGLTGVSARDDLARCTPHCIQEDIDSARGKFLVADVSLGVSLVALSAAGILFFARRD